MLILLFLLIPLANSIHITPYDDFCRPEDIYKPYIKYYRGRLEGIKQGVPIKTLGPGLHFDIDPDTYVCVNGMAWLYYSKIIGGNIVFSTPELHSFIHHCSLQNGVAGPGVMENNPSNVTKLLLAILLMGDKNDYRLPSLQLFHAPYQDDKGILINATSILLIGDETECKLNKGKEKLRIRTEPQTEDVKSGYSGSFCKLSYQFIENNIVKAPDHVTEPPPIAPDTDPKTYQKTYPLYTPPLTTPEDIIYIDEVKKLLINSPVIVPQGCYVPDNYNEETANTITKRYEELQSLYNATDTESVLKDPSKFGEYFDVKFKTGIFATKADFHPKDGLCVPTVAPALNACDPKDIEDKVKPLPKVTDADKIVIAQLQLAPCQFQAFKLHKELMNTYSTAGKVWERLVKSLGFNTKTAAAGRKRREIRQKRQGEVGTLPLPEITDSKYQALLDALKAAQETKVAVDIETAQKNLDDHLAVQKLVLPPFVSLGETLRLKMDSLIKQTKEAFEELVVQFNAAQSGQDAKCVFKPEGVETLGNIFIARKKATPLVANRDETIPDPSLPPTLFPSTTLAAKEHTCGQLPNYEKTCKDYKPKIDRACRLLNARMNDYKTICDDEWECTAKNRRRKRDINIWEEQDKWREEVLSIIAEIFSKISSTVNGIPEISDALLLIMKGYVSGIVPPLGREVKEKKCETPPDDGKGGVGGGGGGVGGRSAGDPNAAKGQTTTQKPEIKEEKKPEAPGKTKREDKAAEAPPAKPEGTPPVTTAPKAPGKSAEKPVAGKPLEDPPPPVVAPPVGGEPVVGLPPGDKEKCPPPKTDGRRKKRSTDPQLLPLPYRHPFWDQILLALNDCKERDLRNYFKKQAGTGDYYFVKRYPTGITEPKKVIKFTEQADLEFDFNYAIDNFWKQFVTVLGACMPYYEKAIPLITSKTYAHFTEDFMFPLAAEWVSNRDNHILKNLMGPDFETRGRMWVHNIMEASFIRSADGKWRPPRALMVNGLSEMNFFISGPVLDDHGWFTGLSWKDKPYSA